jgi:hypothetical protein
MGSFTLYFDGQFWVGLATRESAGAVQVARVVFGPEPSDQELLAWARDHFHALAYKDVDESAARLLRDRPCGNPKRRQRAASRSLEDATGRTRAQEAWQVAFEAEKGQRHSEARARRRALADERYAQRAEKRKRAKRGK